jgi:hypothetical protein
MEDVNKTLEERLASPEASLIMHNLLYASSKVRSLRRAFKRGRLTQFGLLISKRPFNNRANTSKRNGKSSRFVTEQKKRDYEYAKRKAIEQSL